MFEVENNPNSEAESEVCGLEVVATVAQKQRDAPERELNSTPPTSHVHATRRGMGAYVPYSDSTRLLRGTHPSAVHIRYRARERTSGYGIMNEFIE